MNDCLDDASFLLLTFDFIESVLAGYGPDADRIQSEFNTKYKITFVSYWQKEILPVDAVGSCKYCALVDNFSGTIMVASKERIFLKRYLQINDLKKKLKASRISQQVCSA